MYIKLGAPFKSKEYVYDQEVFIVSSANLDMDECTVKVHKSFNGELWETRRIVQYSRLQKDFENGVYKYMDDKSKTPPKPNPKPNI